LKKFSDDAIENPHLLFPSLAPAFPWKIQRHLKDRVLATFVNELRTHFAFARAILVQKIVGTLNRSLLSTD
jgi:hypothetical protein